MKACKTETSEKNYKIITEKILLQCVSQNSLKRTFDDVLSYLLKKTPLQCFCTTFVEIAILKVKLLSFIKLLSLISN